MTSKFKKKIGLDDANSIPKDLRRKRIMFDEESVSSCYELIGAWNNPFEESIAMVGLSLGRAGTSRGLCSKFSLFSGSGTEMTSHATFKMSIIAAKKEILT